jgi:Icc-related predicted phosphoesterase
VLELKQDSKKVDELFTRVMLETVERWIRVAEERMKRTGIKCYVMPSNDDQLIIDEAINKSDYIVNPEGKFIQLDEDHEMISTGYSNVTPWMCPRDIPEEELEKKIEVMTTRVENMPNCIFNFHCPPQGTSLDVAPKLDENLKPVVSGGAVVEAHVGSTVVKNAIERYQPMLGMHWHIHESKGTYDIGRTLCITPGSEYTEGILPSVLIVIDEKKVKSFLPI